MAKVTQITTQFSGGELSPRLDGRVDVKKYASGCRTIENFTVVPHGGARKRPGTRFVVELPEAADDVVLVPFQYNVEQSYVLIFGPEYVWFAKDQGIITQTPTNITAVTQSSPAVVTSVAHGLANGDIVVISSVVGMVELNNRQFVVTNKTADTFQLYDYAGAAVDSTAYTAYTSGGTVGGIVELTTTYAADEIADLTFAQSNDTLYIAHKSHTLRKLTRTSHTNWTLSEPDISTGPFRTINGDDNKDITVSGFSSGATAFGTHVVGETFTLTASQAIFNSGHVGALWRLNENGGAVGVAGASLGDSTKTLANGDTYTNDGKIYGVSSLTSATTWEKFNRVPSHDSGIVKVTGSVAGGGTYFFSNFLHPGYCVVRITAVASDISATAQIVRYQMPASIVSAGTTYWEEGAWSTYRGYPRAISFYEQRLMLAGSDSDPTVIWGSRSGAYEDFEDGSDDNDAIVYRVAAGSADVFRWLVSGRVLSGGSSFGEFAISASNLNEALTPSNFKAVPQTSYGTSRAHPVRVNQTVLYPQRAGDVDNAAKKLREFAYDYANDAYNSTDLTIFSEHITGAGFNRIGYQLTPESNILLCRTDGQLATCTYERAQEIVAWSRYRLGGTGLAQTLCVLPGDNGDEIWTVVDRTVDSTAVRYVEVFSPPFGDTDSKADCTNIDSHLTYSGASTTTISGLWHLRGETVKILNNGSAETQTVSATGGLTLDIATTKACIGYAYNAILETEDFEAGAQAGTAQSRMKRINNIFVRVLNSLGGTVGPDADNQMTILYRETSDQMGGSPALQSGLIENDFPGGFERWARVRIEHSDPLPFHITGIVCELSTCG